MTEKEFQEHRLELGRYRSTFNRLQRRTEELRRWKEVSWGTSGEMVGRNRPRAAPGDCGGVAGMVGTIDELERECEKLSDRALRERDVLVRCIALLPSERQRDLLERLYVNGQTQDRVAAEWQVSHRTVRRMLATAVICLDEASDFFAD